MEYKECEKKILEMMKDLEITIIQEANRLFHSGAIDITRYPNNEYALPKIILTAALNNVKNNYKPRHAAGLYELKNLLKF